MLESRTARYATHTVYTTSISMPIGFLGVACARPSERSVSGRVAARAPEHDPARLAYGYRVSFYSFSSQLQKADLSIGARARRCSTLLVRGTVGARAPKPKWSVACAKPRALDGAFRRGA